MASTALSLLRTANYFFAHALHNFGMQLTSSLCSREDADRNSLAVQMTRSLVRLAADPHGVRTQITTLEEMPRVIDRNEYRLCGIDTNVVSQISKDPPRYFAALERVLGPANRALCFSPYTLFELRCRPDVYERFLNVFDVYPCLLLKNEEQLFAEERDSYPNYSLVEPALLGFSMLNRHRGTNLRRVLDVALSEESFLTREADWPRLKLELLEEWTRLRGNYPPKGRTYLLPEAAEFARQATLQHIAARDYPWYSEQVRKGKRPISSSFPSVVMTLLTVFFRIYEPVGRKPVPQDVFDVLISTPTPYLDEVVTEGMQAAIIAKAKKIFPAIRHVTIVSMRDLQAVLQS